MTDGMTLRFWKTWTTCKPHLLIDRGAAGMSAFLLVVSFGGLISILFYVAILVIVIWAIIALVNWLGWTIPEPVRIIFIALICIVLVVLLFRALGFIV